MGSRYRGATSRDRLAKGARTGDHWGAKQAAAEPPDSFVAGDKVKLVANGKITTVKDKNTFGYTLDGFEGHFPPGTIVRA